MSKLFLVFILFLFVSPSVKASFVPAPTSETKTYKSMSVSEYEALTGKKLNWVQKIQFKHAQKMLAKGNISAFWDAEELTEGFQVWPFLGSIFTLGI